MTQQEIILNILQDGNWHCTNSMYASYIADPRTRLVELKKKGYELEWRWCQQHDHKRSKEWRLIQKKTEVILSPKQYEQRLFAPSSVYE